ncbi:MAG: hypothetical protein ACXAD7_00390 [Candidatus Kariarchaeaceae archaeon]|jgi:hypothetical protein
MIDPLKEEENSKLRMYVRQYYGHTGVNYDGTIDKDIVHMLSVGRSLPGLPRPSIDTVKLAQRYLKNFRWANTYQKYKKE